ncbi:MAG: hypothetical protein FD180_3165 [Planctomycetota bacterium]|nr:MAG: hypothetical protein FD180_3165 [Planctomycetota bacterium]
MRLPLAVMFLALPLSASAQWAASLSKAEADGKAKRRPVLILVWAKGDAASDRLEKEIWSVEPVKTVLRNFTAVKVEKVALGDAKTWAAVPRWKAQADGDAAVPEVRIIHPWGKELARYPLKASTPADLGAKLKAEIDTWEERQAPIRLDARELELKLRGQEKEPIHEAVRKVISHREP